MSAESALSPIQAPARYSVSREGSGDGAKLVMDGGTGRSRAEIALRGANLFRWVLAQGTRGELDLIESPPRVEALAKDPWAYGTPVLAPWPNRIANARFAWEGGTVRVPSNFPGGHAIHGLVGNMLWDVVEEEEEPDFARAKLSAGWTRTHGPDAWPFAFRATLEIVLREGQVALELAVENLSDRPMPAGLGLHPYFRLPFGEGTRDDYELTVPARERWATNAEVLPTGKRVRLEGVEAWAEGRPLFSSIRLDDLFGDLERRGKRGESVCALRWTLGGKRLEIVGGDTVRHWQVYTPPRDSIAIEPQTCVIDAFNMADKGVDSGMEVVEPGGTFSMRAAFRCLPADAES